MMHFITSAKTKKFAATLAAVLFWLAVWQLTYAKIAQELLLASPAQAFLRLFALCRQLLFWQSIALTLLRVVVGFLLALFFGLLLAALCARFSFLRILFAPLLGTVRATPVASFIILALLWVQTSRLPTFIAFLMVLPVAWANLYAGITAADQSLLEVATVFRFSPFKTIRTIYVPAIMPFFISACSVGLGFAWKSAIAAEIICLPRAAVGRQLYNARIYLETRDLFAWTIAVILLSILIEKLMMAALKRLQKQGGRL